MTDQRHGGIAWTDETWSPIRGCSRVSPGCEHCYAERQAYRFHGPGQPYDGLVKLGRQGPQWTGVVRLVPEKLAEPLSWRKPRRVFVNSMSDLFHDALSDADIAAVFGVMAASPRHTFQALTKRAERMRAVMSTLSPRIISGAAADVLAVSPMPMAAGEYPEGLLRARDAPWPLPNVHLGVSVEDQKRADERIPHLLATPAAVHWVSYEPGLGPVDFSRWLRRGALCGCDVTATESEMCNGALIRCNVGLRSLSWLVCGGESGPSARPFDIEWARSVIAQCKAAGVPCFVKQLGANVRWNGSEGPGCRWPRSTGSRDMGDGSLRKYLVHPKGGDPAEWPEDLRVREWAS